MKKINWTAVLIAFLVGLLLGRSWEWYGKRFFQPQWRGEGRSAKMLERFSRKLDLTVEQKQKVGTIFETKKKKMDELRGMMRPKFEELRTSTKQEISQVLTPEQLKKFETMEARWEKHRARWRHKPGPPPPPGEPGPPPEMP